MTHTDLVVNTKLHEIATAVMIQKMIAARDARRLENARKPVAK
jgi:hypothetical protein